VGGRASDLGSGRGPRFERESITQSLCQT